MNPGEIYYALTEGGKKRPILIVSAKQFNRGRYVVAIPFTSANFAVRSKFPNCVPFRTGEFGLTKDCVAQAEAISVIEIADMEEHIVGVLDEATMRKVINAIGYVIASQCEPN